MSLEVMKQALEALGAYMEATDSEQDEKAHNLMATVFFKLKEAIEQAEEKNCKNCVIDKPCIAKGKDMQICGAFIPKHKDCGSSPHESHWGASSVTKPEYVAAQKEKTQRVLDKMAENARELGLDYEPVPWIENMTIDSTNELSKPTTPVQEPVAWMYDWTTSEGEFIQDWTTSEVETLRDTEPTIISNVRPLYLHPAKWQSLTLEEHYDLADKAGCMSADWIDYARAIEKALKEKNT
jgi:hypothetical protein